MAGVGLPIYIYAVDFMGSEFGIPGPIPIWWCQTQNSEADRIYYGVRASLIVC